MANGLLKQCPDCKQWGSPEDMVLDYDADHNLQYFHGDCIGEDLEETVLDA